MGRTKGRPRPDPCRLGDWLCACFTDRDQPDDAPLDTRVEAHVALAERIAQGCVGDGSGTLWERSREEARKAHGRVARRGRARRRAQRPDYASLFHSILSGEEVRDPTEPHPHIRIWGTLEARVQGADLLILAGLNEGSWPEAPKPDPWLNRALRVRRGCLLPERRIGLRRMISSRPSPRARSG